MQRISKNDILIYTRLELKYLLVNFKFNSNPQKTELDSYLEVHPEVGAPGLGRLGGIIGLCGVSAHDVEVGFVA